jgi:predicted lipoprotein with Yx(FWY)xxD motif
MRRAYRAAAAALVLLGACTTGAGPTTTTTTVAATSVPPSVASGSLGDYLVDGSGRSLYVFALDDERTSTCVGACADLWPPLLGDPRAESGVDRSLLGNAERANGAIQVTYAGHPLYHYTDDVAPGDTQGQGFNDVWFLISPSGEPLTG